MAKKPEAKKIILVALLLSALVLASYRGVQENEFLNYDDPTYVTENRHVKDGLTWEGVGWAFTASYAGNWHPLTWLSLMLDHDLFGMNAARFHRTSVILHGVAALVLFGALFRMTGDLWCSGLVAGLFGLHPLHVESVAWAAERKDVLSGLFWMLGLWGYARYAERPGLRRYWPVVLFFVMGLLSKPMVVTFPFALLLLDYWPLQRLEGDFSRKIGPLLYEKIPLMVLSAVGSTITFLVQKDGEAVASLQHLSLADRLGNAAVSCAGYLVKMVWPFNLAVFYPHPVTWPVWDVLAAVLLVLLTTVFVLLQSRRRPYLLTGWFWYLGTLVPVIGLVQVGAQAMADRYTYLPLIGIFLMVAWGLRELPVKRSVFPLVWGSIAGCVLAILAVLTQIQVGYWRDSSVLFRRALEATDHNYQAHNHLGRALAAVSRYEDAADQYREAIRISPNYIDAYKNLGRARMEQGRFEEAMIAYERALEIRPGDGNVHFHRGDLFSRTKRWGEAITDYRVALKTKPYDPDLHNSLGVAWLHRGMPSEAADEYRLAMKLDPRHTGARRNLAALLNGKDPRDEDLYPIDVAGRRNPEIPETRPEAVPARRPMDADSTGRQTDR